MKPVAQLEPTPDGPTSTIGDRVALLPGLASLRPLKAIPSSKGGIAGGVIVAVAVLAALTAPVLGWQNPAKTNLLQQNLGLFSPGHFLGTDELGRDMLSRLVWGARPALLEGVVPVAVSTIVGSVLGGISGFVGGATETITMRIVDVFVAIPPVMLGIAVAASLGSGVRNVVIAMSILLIAPMTRVARGAVLTVKNELYVTAARSAGVTEWRILYYHVLPNAASSIIAYAFSLVGIMIVFAAGLSFIGLGVQPPTPDWGTMINEGQALLSTAPWVATLPGLAIFVVGLGFGLLGEWVDEVVSAR